MVNGILNQLIEKKECSFPFKKQLKEDIFKYLSNVQKENNPLYEQHKHNYKKKLSYIIKIILHHTNLSKVQTFLREEVCMLKAQLFQKILKGNYFQQDAKENLNTKYLVCKC